MCPLSSDEAGPAAADNEFQVATQTKNLPVSPIPYWRRYGDAVPLHVAPCVLYAAAFTLGILVDRLADPRPLSGFLVAGAGAIAWLLARLLTRPVLQVAGICLVLGGLGAAHHHLWLMDEGPSDICRLTDERPRPIQVRGIIEQEPINLQKNAADELRKQPAGVRYRSILGVTSRKADEGWIPATGRAELSVVAPLSGLHRGDEVEVVGRLQAFSSPMNPGEADQAARARARGVHAQITVVKVAQAVTPLSTGSPWSPARKLDQLRGGAVRVLERYLPPGQVGLAAALLLGEDSYLSQAEWDRYMRTGVVAVLVVSGQHLSLLAGWMWLLLCLFNIPRRQTAIVVGVVLLLYSFLTGAQPPILRAAVMSAVLCGSFLVRRPVLDINTLALAWLVVLIFNPTDLFSPGCQLSFISIAIVFWALRPLKREGPDALEKQIELTRPVWLQWCRGSGRRILADYRATFVFMVLLAPLVAFNYHTFAWQALLIGPPVVFFSGLALMAGFVLLLTGSLLPPLAMLAAYALRLNLFLADELVRLADGLGGRVFFTDLPAWWIGLFYAGLAALLLVPSWRKLRYAVAFALCWLSMGGLCVWERQSAAELRCTFLAVGHGGCAVIEMPDGRVVLYDVGAIAGPEVARYHVQPYLWSRGIRKIDEVILSHADLDHFNGLPDLLDHFSIGQVTTTPTFSNKDTPGVRVVLERLHARGVATRIVTAGNLLRAANVTMRVLHPPDQGPPGNENTRSLVLHLEHEGHSILFTGDLEGAGRTMVLSEPIAPVDVLMAPHHGSATVNDDRLAQWASPKAVVSCEGPPRIQTRPKEPYSARGIKFFGTWPHGAITIRSNRHGMMLETFASDQRLVIRRD